MGGDRVVLTAIPSEWEHYYVTASVLFLLNASGTIQSSSIGATPPTNFPRGSVLVSWKGERPMWTPVSCIKLEPISDNELAEVYRSLGVDPRENK